MMWIAITLTTLVVVALLALRTLAHSFFYPTAPPMPPVVEKPISEILKDLEDQMQDKAPLVFERLQPGLSDDEIAGLEQRGGFKFPEDMAALYGWHNGCRDWSFPQEPGPMTTTVGPIPGHRFIPLEEALAQRDDLTKQAADSTFGQKIFDDMFASHRRTWITLFGDVCGDGYFYDPGRKHSKGAFFYCFAEDGTYVFFPSVKNLLEWVVKCYELGAFKWREGSDVPDLEEDFKLSREIQKAFASSL